MATRSLESRPTFFTGSDTHQKFKILLNLRLTCGQCVVKGAFVSADQTYLSFTLLVGRTYSNEVSQSPSVILSSGVFPNFSSAPSYLPWLYVAMSFWVVHAFVSLQGPKEGCFMMQSDSHRSVHAPNTSLLPSSSDDCDHVLLLASLKQVLV